MQVYELPDGYDVLNRLENDVSAVRWSAQGNDIDHEFCLFSKSGFRQSLLDAADAREDLRLFSIDDVVTSV